MPTTGSHPRSLVSLDYSFSKERAWTAQAEAQGETFYPLAIEAGGTLNARFHEFLQLLAVASSPSPAERAAFMAFALQRVRAVSLKGTCAIILARPVSRTAPGGVHRRGALPLIQPKPRPRVWSPVSYTHLTLPTTPYV